MAKWPFAPGPGPELPDDDEPPSWKQEVNPFTSDTPPLTPETLSDQFQALLHACGYPCDPRKVQQHRRRLAIAAARRRVHGCAHRRVLVTAGDDPRCLDCGLAGYSLKLALGLTDDDDDDDEEPA